jgi:NAD(P)-dependent dehydrogenase (short-subunit alcohol dehydrogenase family)
MSARRVLITGAASGLGLGLAKRYAANGDRIAVVDLTMERAESGRDQLSGSGHAAFAADVGSDESMQSLYENVKREWGGVDILINNAGIASGGTLLESTMQEWDKLLNIDLLSVVRGCKYFLPDMIAQGHGQVLSTASFAGLAGAPGIMSYGVAKAGVVALSEALRAEMHHKNIKVGVICPSFFRTNLLDTAIGTDKIRSIGLRLMDTSPDTVESVSENIFNAAQRGQFLIIPTKREPMRWRFKRYFPNWYFKMLLKMSGKMAS